MRKTLLLISFFLLLLQCHAQQYNVWCFGEEAGLDFNSNGNNPVPIALTNNAMITSEGCSSIADRNGNLLFYSNGVEVYNRNHQIMLNGNGLKGNTSTVQSSIIVPHPGDSNLYYIFTADAIENLFANGYCYSIVDVRGDNGKGEVVSKNNLLWSSSCERLAAARHANGTDVWIITNDNSSNTFRSWLINCNGLQAAPVISATGEMLNQHGFMNVGMIKLSPDGKQLCQTHYPQLDIPGGNPSNFFQLFDFDNSTGIISNAKKIGEPGFTYFACEFSSNSSLLYLIRFFGNTLDQFQPKLAGVPAILASKYSFTTANRFYGIQLAPDDKIYLCRSSSLMSVISNPDIPGPGCNFVNDQVNLGVKKATLGLPSFINDAASDPYNNFTYTILDSCSGMIQFTGITQLQGNVVWSWDFGDGTTSSLQNPVHQFTPAQQDYIVKLTIRSDVQCSRKIEKVKTVSPSGIANKIDFQVMVSCDTVRLINTTPNAGNLSGQFTWDFGDGTSSNEISPTHIFTAGNHTIQLSLTTGNPCLNKIISHSINITPLTIQVPPGQTIDAGQSVHLSVSGGGSGFQWTPPQWLDDPTIQNPVATPQQDITYVITVTNNAGCKDVDSVSIHVNSIDGIFVPTGFTPGGNGLNDILKPVMGIQYTLIEFSIYNRWGQKVFSTSQYGKGWDGQSNGQIQPGGVYVWFVSALDPLKKKIEKKGTVTLIR